MPLGIEQNNIAPRLIQDSGAALVQGIRQIGQQISGHITEIQTKRDLGAMAQELQGINVQSNEFPVQLTQMLSRHPLAARDERGQMALSILGKAHGQWQAGEAEARAFNRAMAMQTRRTQDARAEFDYEEAARAKRPLNVPGVGLVQPNEVDPVTGQANVLVPAPARGSTALPFASTPGGVLDKRTGAVTPAPARPATELQRSQLRRAERKDKVSALNAEINQFDSDITSAERAYEAAFKRELDTDDEVEKQKHISTKTELGKVADALKAEKKKRLEILRKIREDDDADVVVVEPEVETELGPVPASAAAPSVLPAMGEIVIVDVNSKADAEKLPSGTKFRIDGRTYTRK